LLIVFVSSCWELTRELGHMPRQGHDYWVDAAAFLVILAMFAVYRWHSRRSAKP
jgi:hypothetical protein